VTLRQKIDQEIRVRGAIPFSRYMEMSLYDPEFGYYSRNAEQFGKAGDFYTSSDVHAVFGRLMARQFDEMWRALGSPEHIEILELGPGRGLFARDVLDWSEKKFPGFFQALDYTLMEQSAVLRSRLQAGLARHFETGKASLVTPRDGMVLPRALPPDLPVIIFANEFFDALPVEIVSSEGWLHLTEGLAETWKPPSPEQLEFLDRYSVRPGPGERFEVPLLAQQWASQVAATIPRGFLIAVDYGYTRDQQIAGRHRGTLMSYRQHSASPNPYQAPGEQDMTAHVNFTGLAATVKDMGLAPQPLLTQSQFLLGIGESNQFADAFEECRLPQERAKVALQLKHLVTPAGVGESFRVLVACKGIDPVEVSRLSGLGFGSQRRHSPTSSTG
jgi:SAM-dependent MidA family methyltransferase